MSYEKIDPVPSPADLAANRADDSNKKVEQLERALSESLSEVAQLRWQVERMEASIGKIAGVLQALINKFPKEEEPKAKPEVTP